MRWRCAARLHYSQAAEAESIRRSRRIGRETLGYLLSAIRAGLFSLKFLSARALRPGKRNGKPDLKSVLRCRERSILVAETGRVALDEYTTKHDHARRDNRNSPPLSKCKMAYIAHVPAGRNARDKSWRVSQG